MINRLIILLTLVGLSLGQSSFDILNAPTDARDAALGISLNPTVKPARLISNPEKIVTLSVWNWVADIQGAYIGISRENNHFSVQALHSGELEYRNELPSEEPISTFEYTLFNLGAAHAHQWDKVSLGLGAEIIYERTLNSSATGLSLNLASSYALSNNLLLGGGLRHWGVTGKLDTENTTLPSEAWLSLDMDISSKASTMLEVNTGSFPLAIGMIYPILDGFEIMAGLQVEAFSEPSTIVHPSAGFTADWSSFTLGYSIYQIDHNLGPRHFITLYWNY